jgi:Flp pilus assembly protein TadD
MRIELSINNFRARAAATLLILTACAMLSYAVVSNFIVSALTDERANVARDTLRAAVERFPSSGRLHARLAEVLEKESNMVEAQSHALRAITLSPFNYNYHLLLATITESNGEPSAAEQSLREAIKLAPNKTEPHWQIANLLLRAGKLGKAVDEFRIACSMNKKLLPVTLNIIWRASAGRLDAVEAVAAQDAKSQLALAGFLLKQSRIPEAASVFNQVESKARMELPEGREFINALIASNQIEIARDFFLDLAGGNGKDRPLIYNGSFESDIQKDFAQFDWAIDRSDYAKIKVLAGQARTGSRALKIEFTGRDTTRLSGEIRQSTIFRPGARYRLECYAKADNLSTSEGPRVAVTAQGDSSWIAMSEPVQAAQTGWQRLSIEFTAPEIGEGQAAALNITIRRKPKFSYDEPTTGAIWFDDFTLTEVKESL